MAEKNVRDALVRLGKATSALKLAQLKAFGGVPTFGGRCGDEQNAVYEAIDDVLNAAALSPPEAQGSQPLDVEAMAHTLAVAFGKESRHNPAWILHNWHALCGISAPHHIDDCLRFMPKPAHLESQGTASAAGSAPTIDEHGDYVCEHGTAMDVHCCNCHSGFIFDLEHECEDSAGSAPDNRYGDTLKYTATADRPCGACSGIILKGALCYRYGNWKGDEEHTFQHLFHVDSGKAEAAPPHAPLSTQFVDAINREDWHTATILLIQKVDGLYRDEAPHATAQWQPIETAKKLKPVLVYVPMEPLGLVVKARLHHGGEWLTYEGHEIKPTHWMPLPLPPSTPAPARRETD